MKQKFIALFSRFPILNLSVRGSLLFTVLVTTHFVSAQTAADRNSQNNERYRLTADYHNIEDSAVSKYILLGSEQLNFLNIKDTNHTELPYFKIVGYKFTHISDSGVYRTEITSNSLKPLQTILSKAKSGDFYMFTDIRCEISGDNEKPQIVYLGNVAYQFQ
ncbi:MAG: hypothetical protein KG003_07920 [Bacteroidetes bacterium]|nr:hypothetical protein [Bacteroidota bacterium]